jgi:uncharacterized protein (DUF58 family)
MIYEDSRVKPTRRIFAITILGFFLIISDIFWRNNLMYLGIFFIFLIPLSKNYVETARNIIKRIKINVEALGNIEGKEITIIHRIHNTYNMPVFPLELSLKYPSYFKLIKGSPGGIFLLLPKGYINYKVSFLGRIGEHEIGPLRAVIRDPLGLFRFETVLNNKFTIRIYPKSENVRVARLVVQARTVGLSRTQSKGTGIEFYDVKEFQEGDELRRVYWNAVAKYNKLYVKEFEREITLNIMLVLDASRIMFIGNWGQTPLEQGARTFSSIAKYASIRDDKIGLLWFSEKHLNISPMKRGRVALTNIIKILSSIRWDMLTFNDYDRINALNKAARELVKNLSRDKNIIIFFTAPGNKDYVDTLIKHLLALKNRGNDVYVIIPLTVAYEATTIAEWQTIIYRLRSLDKLKSDLAFASTLRSKGIPTIAVGPRDITQKVINLLEIMRSSMG